jgi:HNH endonuclease
MTSLPAVTGGGLVVRSSDVPPDRPYNEYKQWLRHDFFCSCAYCSMSEAEAQARRFTIDHYEPKKARPELVNDYNNLMYCCDECNMRKGDRCPPLSARENGIRFFRPDADRWQEHFERNGVRLVPVSKVGSFTIDAVDLNRKALRTLREIRERIAHCNDQISQGVLALKRFPIDRLPPQIRAKALQYIKQAVRVDQDLTKAIEHVLRESAKSPLLDEDSAPELQERMRERQARLDETEALHPGIWRKRKAKGK